MLVTLSQAQCPTEQAQTHHIETVFSDISVGFENLSKLTSSKRYSSAQFNDGKRKKSNFNGFGNILIYDVDNDADSILPLLEAVTLFEEVSSLVVTTKSHQKEKNGIVSDRYRILIPLDEAISIDLSEYSDYYLHVASLLGIETYIDNACKDAARMYQPNYCQKVYYSQSEIVLNELQLRISFEEKKFIENSSREVLITDAKPDYGNSKIEYLRSIIQTQGLLDLLRYDAKFVQGNRNNYLYSVGCYLIDNCLSKKEVRDTLVWMNSLKDSINEVELDRTIMRSLKI